MSNNFSIEWSKYYTEGNKKRYIAICVTILVICLIFIIGAGILFGFLDLMKPFNALPIAIIMIALGGIGTIAAFVILLSLLD